MTGSGKPRRVASVDHALQTPTPFVPSPPTHPTPTAWPPAWRRSYPPKPPTPKQFFFSILEFRNTLDTLQVQCPRFISQKPEPQGFRLAAETERPHLASHSSEDWLTPGQGFLLGLGTR